jgi:hypothetical protein
MHGDALSSRVKEIHHKNDIFKHNKSTTGGEVRLDTQIEIITKPHKGDNNK